MFDILEQLHTLPGAVLANVLYFLPSAFVGALACSSHAGLVEVATCRRWREVSISMFGLGALSRSVERYAFHINLHEFTTMLSRGTPPPRRIHRVFYSAPTEPDDDLLFMTPAWRMYVAAHTDNICLKFSDYGGDTTAWEVAAPFFNELNVVGLSMYMQHTYGMALRAVLWTTLPRNLHLLDVVLGDVDGADVSRIVVPDSVVRLQLRVSGGIHPTALPLLPPELRVFEYLAPDGIDMSEYVGVFPRTLERLKVVTSEIPAVIELNAVGLFPQLLQHNMFVYSRRCQFNRAEPHPLSSRIPRQVPTSPPSATTFPPMFDIVEHICELPYVVLTVLFPLLPIRTTDLYRTCHLPEIRELARAQRWRDVLLRVEGENYTNRLHSHGCTIQDYVFELAVLSGTPPPFAISRLTVDHTESWDDVLEWLDYINMHVDSVYMYVSDTNGFSITGSPNLNVLGKIRGLVFDKGMLHRLGDPVQILSYQRLSSLVIGGCSHRHYYKLVIPESVTSIVLPCSLRPASLLPILPAGLQHLSVVDASITDLSPIVPFLPHGLRTLGVYLHSERPVTILKREMDQFLCLHLHNLDVIHDLETYGYLGRNSDGVWVVDVDRGADYTQYRPPPGVERLRIVTVRGELDEDCVALVLALFPELQKVSVECVHSRERRIVEASQDWTDSGPADLVMGSITRSLTRLSLALCDLTTIPRFVRRCALLEVLDMSYNPISVAGMSTNDIPPGVQWLAFQGCANKVAVDETATADFRHLGRLERLDILECDLTEVLEIQCPSSLRVLDVSERKTCDTIDPPRRLRHREPPREPSKTRPSYGKLPWWRHLHQPTNHEPRDTLRVQCCTGEHLLKIRFPDGLLRVDVLTQSFAAAGSAAVKWPPRLVSLKLRCWSSGDMRPLRLPNHLRELDLLDNHSYGLPRGHGMREFPSGLELLNLENCYIRSLSGFVFPSSLNQLCLRANNFRVSADFAWPPRCRVVLLDTENGRALFPRVRREVLAELETRFPESAFEAVVEARAP